MNRKIFIVHLVLFSVTLFWAYMLAALNFRKPANGLGTGYLNLMEASMDNKEKVSPDTYPFNGDSALQDKYSHLENSPIFKDIIPKPTPKPTPTPPPPTPPDIDVIKWKVTSIYGITASFQNPHNKSEWTMKVGDTYDITYGKLKWPVKLEKIIEDKFEVIISLGNQKKTISMW